jgi:hypothetical protein
MKALAAIVTAILVLAFVLWRLREDRPPAAATAAPDPASAPAAPPPADTPPPAASVPAPAAPAPLPPRLSPAEVQRVRDAIGNLEFVFRDHAAALGGNPVGTNAEITAALRGDNAKQLKLEIPEGSTVNDRGELCDPWGTPWFFHQLSGTRMEIRSAGPDRVLHSDDDFVR